MKIFINSLCLAALAATSGLSASRLVDFRLRDAKSMVSLSEYGARKRALGSLKRRCFSPVPYVQKRFYNFHNKNDGEGTKDQELTDNRLFKSMEFPKILVTVVPYNEDWPRLFEEEASKIRQILGQECQAIYHIGSTSVPGLSAKPVIDMMPVVKNISQIDNYKTAMEAQGYEARGMCHFTLGYLFKRDVPDPACYVRVFEDGNPEIDFHLRFRNYLRTHDCARDSYTALKLNLAQKHSYDILSYCLGKSDFFRQSYAKMRWEEEAREIEKKMIKIGMPVKKVAEITDLNLKEVEELKVLARTEKE